MWGQQRAVVMVANWALQMVVKKALHLGNLKVVLLEQRLSIAFV